MCSSTNRTGRPSGFRLGLKSQSRSRHPATTSVGDFLLGLSMKLSGPSLARHHGQWVSGKGDDGFFAELVLYSVSFSPTSVMVLAVALRPTHSPTAKRT